ncbi:MAG TPA: Lrp/AsnC ligand binding domain-containing protein [Nitrosopumilaceae archaeon]|nr:Lrp/AsnC ligand binding domain-containing protein [Nitrosopumilaceae archaeon]
MNSETSYILLTCDSGKRDHVKKEIESFEEVKEAVGTYGIYDIVLKIKLESDEESLNFVKEKIRNVDHVRSLLTLSLPEWGSITFPKN